MKSMRVTPARIFLLLIVMLSYIFASAIWLIHFAPGLIGSSSEFEVVSGFFGVSVWMIATACLALSVIGTPPTSRQSVEPFNIDSHVHMIVDARRYQWLRDRDRITDVDTDLCVVRDETVYFGHDLDMEIDNALRLARLEELHP
ncbi:hypothetical protein K0P33_21285 [Pseudomonas sp. ArH3a]|uniref:hypothetical protein n=1 Tax=Pseudomonas sp. ArH3a TaxID=2862945 RepID=UPI001F5A6A00|nr:hypothetical protein [Pseudomonas sp. ArH3a]UNM18075.1 hypothetical protein K0P33_21285 [Pseudomonas sp. ArH3a]